MACAQGGELRRRQCGAQLLYLKVARRLIRVGPGLPARALESVHGLGCWRGWVSRPRSSAGPQTVTITDSAHAGGRPL